MAATLNCPLNNAVKNEKIIKKKLKVTRQEVFVCQNEHNPKPDCKCNLNGYYASDLPLQVLFSFTCNHKQSVFIHYKKCKGIIIINSTKTQRNIFLWKLTRLTAVVLLLNNNQFKENRKHNIHVCWNNSSIIQGKCLFLELWLQGYPSESYANLCRCRSKFHMAHASYQCRAN